MVQIVYTNIGITEYNRQVPWCSDKRSYTVYVLGHFTHSKLKHDKRFSHNKLILTIKCNVKR